MRVHLDVGLPGLGLGEVFLELDADELPLLGLLGDLGWGEGFHVLAGGVLEILVALRLDDIGGSFVLEFELEVELLLLLRAVIGVVDGQRFLQLMVLLEINGVYFFEAFELLVVAAVAADAAAMGALVPARKDIALQFGPLEPQVDGLSNFPLLLGEDEDWLFDGYLGLAGLFGAGLGGVGLVGVVPRPLVFLLGLGLEEVKGLVHGYQRQIIIISVDWKSIKTIRSHGWC